MTTRTEEGVVRAEEVFAVDEDLCFFTDEDGTQITLDIDSTKTLRREEQTI